MLCELCYKGVGQWQTNNHNLEFVTFQIDNNYIHINHIIIGDKESNYFQNQNHDKIN